MAQAGGVVADAVPAVRSPTTTKVVMAKPGNGRLDGTRGICSTVAGFMTCR